MLRRMVSARQTAEAVTAGVATAEQTVADALERVERARRLGAFLAVPAERALARARALDEARRAGAASGPLEGVPIVVKDNLCVEGVVTTAGSRSLERFVPPYSATVVRRLEAAGAVVVAKSNLDEFGMGSSNENSAFGPVKNPWDPARVSGGSSGGSAAAVAAGVVPLALGTDTGGSVRLPASFCGIVGFKPTYGRLSRYGVVAYASSLDQVGVLARDAADVALAMRVMAGQDALDATSLDVPATDFEDSTPGGRLDDHDEHPLAGVRVGVVRELAGDGNADDVRIALERTCSDLVALGAEVVELSVPTVRYAVATYYLIATAEASSNLARYDGMIYSTRIGADALGQEAVMARSRAETLGREVRRRVLMGSYALSAGYYNAYYGKALKVRRLLADDVAHAFESVDLLLTPTTPDVAYPFGEKTSDPLAMYLGDVCTCLANLVGLPAVSVPTAADGSGLPIGMQLLAPPLADARLLEAAAAVRWKAGATAAPVAPVERWSGA